MSAIASFILLPKSRLDSLREVAVPKKGWFGGIQDSYGEYLKKHGREVVRCEFSGLPFATLLVYLKENGIDLMHSEHDELSAFLTKSRSATHFIFTQGHKRAYLDRLIAESFPEAALRDYFNEFNATNEAGIGKQLSEGIGLLHESLNGINESSVIIFSIA